MINTKKLEMATPLEGILFDGSFDSAVDITNILRERLKENLVSLNVQLKNGALQNDSTMEFTSSDERNRVGQKISKTFTVKAQDFIVTSRNSLFVLRGGVWEDLFKVID